MSSLTRIGWTVASAVKTSVPPMHLGARHIGRASQYRGQRLAEPTEGGETDALRSDPLFFTCIRFLAVGDHNRRAPHGRSNRPCGCLSSRQARANEAARSWRVALGGLCGRLRRESEPPREPWAVSYTHLRAHETVLDLVC